MALFILVNVSAQTDEDQLYRHKIEQYTKTQKAGGILCVAGVVLTTVGVTAIIVNLNDMKETNSYYEEDNSYDVTLAAFGIGLGVDMIIGGIILQKVGNRKVKQYQEKLNRFSPHISVQPNSTGISLVYRF
jgi:hypothetical protein